MIRVAERLGFFFTRQKGGHAIYRHADGRRITIPTHGGKEISPAVFGRIIKDLGITKSEFWKK